MYTFVSLSVTTESIQLNGCFNTCRLVLGQAFDLQELLLVGDTKHFIESVHQCSILFFELEFRSSTTALYLLIVCTQLFSNAKPG